jgi:hypothetical protein
LDSGGVNFSMATAQGGPGSAGRATPMGRDGRFHQLAWVLVCIVVSIFNGHLGEFYKAATAGHRVATLLATSYWESECSRQLEQLRREHQEQHPQLRPLPRLTVQQLRYLCYFKVVSAGCHILQTHAHPKAAQLVNNPECPAVSETQVAELLPLIASSKDALLQLEPHNPKSQMMAGGAVVWGNSGYLQPFLDCYLQAHSLGQQQRSDFWVVRSAAGALSLAGHHPHGVSPRSLEAVLNAFQQAVPAPLRRLRPLLPEPWVSSLELSVEAARPFAAVVEQTLQSRQQAGSSRYISRDIGRGDASGGTTSQAVAAASDESTSVWQVWASQNPCQCSGCGEQAVGLRRCSCCKTAGYCR